MQFSFVIYELMITVALNLEGHADYDWLFSSTPQVREQDSQD